MSSEAIEFCEKWLKEANSYTPRGAEGALAQAAFRQHIDKLLDILRSKPKAGEFTKGLRENLQKYPSLPESLHSLIKEDILKACDLLDASNEEIEKLKNQKEYVYKKEITQLKRSFNRYASHDPDCHKISIIGVDNECTCGFDQAKPKDKP